MGILGVYSFKGIVEAVENIVATLL